MIGASNERRGRPCLGIGDKEAEVSDDEKPAAWIPLNSVSQE